MCFNMIKGLSRAPANVGLRYRRLLLREPPPNAKAENGLAQLLVASVMLEHDFIHDPLAYLLYHKAPVSAYQIEEGHVFFEQPGSIGCEEDECCCVTSLGQGITDGLEQRGVA